MGTVFDPSALVRAWVAHDRWCLSLSPEPPQKSKRLPSNAGAAVTARLHAEQAKAAEALGVSVETLVASVIAERVRDPGPDVAGAIERVLATGFEYEVARCSRCGRDIPNYQVYRDFHAEHCPETGPQRRAVEDVELPDVL